MWQEYLLIALMYFSIITTSIAAPWCVSSHPHVKLSAFISWLYLEDVESTRVTRCGLHLEDICRHTAPWWQVHVSVQNSEGFVPAGRDLSWTHALTAIEKTCSKFHFGRIYCCSMYGCVKVNGTALTCH